MGKPWQYNEYMTSYSDQLSLAIPLWVSVVHTVKSWKVNRLLRDKLFRICLATCLVCGEKLETSTTL